MSKNNSLATLKEIRQLDEPRQIEIKDDTESERQPTEMEAPIAIELSNGKLAVGKQLSANDYLLYLEKSMPPRQPGS